MVWLTACPATDTGRVTAAIPWVEDAMARDVYLFWSNVKIIKIFHTRLSPEIWMPILLKSIWMTLGARIFIIYLLCQICVMIIRYLFFLVFFINVLDWNTEIILKYLFLTHMFLAETDMSLEFGIVVALLLVLFGKHFREFLSIWNSWWTW